MARLKIPGDWDGESWQSACIEFPDSPEWRHVIRGLLSSLKLGRVWDENTGTVTEAQAAGLAIFDRSFPFSSCGDVPGGSGGGSGDAAPGWLGAYLSECDDECLSECEGTDMGGCCIRWWKGTLQILQCGEWVDVPEFGAKTSDIEEATGEDYSDPETPLPGDDPAVEEDIRCKVAFSIAHAMRRFWLEVVDIYADVLPLIDAGNRIASRLPEYTIDKTQAAFAVADLALAVGAGLSPSLIMEDPDVAEQDLAKFLTTFLEDKYSVTRAQFETIRVALIGYGAWVEQEIGIEELAVGDFWSHVFASLGAGTVNDLAKQARLLGAGEYGCSSAPLVFPPEVEIPNNATWILDFDFKYSKQGWAQGSNNMAWDNGHGWRGVGYWYGGQRVGIQYPTFDCNASGVLMGTSIVIVIGGQDEEWSPESYDGYMLSFGSSPHVRRHLVSSITGPGRLVLRVDTPLLLYAPANPYQFIFGVSFDLKGTNETPVYIERVTYWGTGTPPLG